MPFSPAEKTAPASNLSIFLRWLMNSWLINTMRTDGNENQRMGERTIYQKLAGLGNGSAVGSGGAERRRRPTAQPTSEINSNTEIHETRSANKANDGYAEIVVFFTAWTRKQRESWVLQVEDYSMFLKKDWNILDMNEQSLTNESEKFSSLRCIVTLTTSTTMPGSMQNIELYKR